MMTRDQADALEALSRALDGYVDDPTCPRCGSVWVEPVGYAILADGGTHPVDLDDADITLHSCNDCGEEF